MDIINERTTVPELLRNTVKRLKIYGRPFLLHKANDKWREISFQETLCRADAIAAYLLSIGVRKGERLALLTENSPEYVFFDQALQQIGAVNVSIYPSLTEQEIEYILNDSGAIGILTGSSFLHKKILKIANRCAQLERIIPAFDGCEEAKLKLRADVVSLKLLTEKGEACFKKNQKELKNIQESVLPADLSALIYTSGTTGLPKGVMLTHANFVQNIKACLEQIPVLGPEETFLSFLPLSHVFERTATYYVACAGGYKIAFTQSLELLGRNMLEIKPTVMSVVPRLLERIHQKAIKAGTSGKIKSKVFSWAMKVGRRCREAKELKKAPSFLLSAQLKLANRFVLNKIREKTGGRLKFMISGGAALQKSTGKFFGDIGIKVLEGYGLTETSPVVSVTEYNRPIYGTVGRVLPNVEVGIQDIDTKALITVQSHWTFHESFECKEGEILVRGPGVMKGYWNKQEETALAIDQASWFHTGDIGRFYRGNLQITDRIKNMLINAYGKNIYPTPVENVYLRSSKIEQIFLIGNQKEYVTAILTLSKEAVKDEFGFDDDFFKKPQPFIEDRVIIDWVKKDIKKLSMELAKFERVKNFKIKRQPFSLEAGELTPTQKIKRKFIEQKYADIINEMYEQPFKRVLKSAAFLRKDASSG